MHKNIPAGISVYFALLAARLYLYIQTYRHTYIDIRIYTHTPIHIPAEITVYLALLAARSNASTNSGFVEVGSLQCTKPAYPVWMFTEARIHTDNENPEVLNVTHVDLGEREEMYDVRPGGQEHIHDELVS
jgi:hypothetical protein